MWPLLVTLLGVAAASTVLGDSVSVSVGDLPTDCPYDFLVSPVLAVFSDSTCGDGVTPSNADVLFVQTPCNNHNCEGPWPLKIASIPEEVFVNVWSQWEYHPKDRPRANATINIFNDSTCQFPPPYFIVVPGWSFNANQLDWPPVCHRIAFLPHLPTFNSWYLTGGASILESSVKTLIAAVIIPLIAQITP